MQGYEMAVVIETITVRAENEAQAEEMYARWNGCGEEDTCIHHPETEVDDRDWDCGCAWTDRDVRHITTEIGPWEGNPWRDN